MIPPPRASPKVPGDIDDGRDEPVTGVFPATREYARHIGNLSLLKAVGGILAGAVISTATAVIWVGVVAKDKAHDVAEARVAPLEGRVTTIEQRLGFTSNDIHEVQLDLRELYRVGRTKERSARLEEPLPLIPRDGGI